MKRLTRYVASRLSVRLSLIVVLSISILLMASLLVMLYYSRKAVKEEALHKAEQALEGTVQHIDNVLLSVEQTAGNIYWNILSHQNNPEKMSNYCRRIVESNPHIQGCAVAFEPYYYKSLGKYFMAYVYRSPSGELESTDSPIVLTKTFGNRPYNEQIWYTKAMEVGLPYWSDPVKKADSKGNEVFTTFSLPFYNTKGEKVGVLAVDVSLSLLSQKVLSTKPSPHSYSTLLGRDGSYIIHPDSNKLLHHTVFTQIKPDTDPSVKTAAEAMVSGETGYLPFRMNGTDYYVFYKPFRRTAVAGRANDRIGWSVGVIYPEDDIFGDYNLLLYFILPIALIALLLLMLLCWAYVHRQLKPLQLLTHSAQRIADGHYDEPVPDSHQHDEIGRLQDTFQQMQQSLFKHVHELEQLTSTLEERSKELNTAYDKAQEGDRIKTKFLHNMTNQMLSPANAIIKYVSTLCDTNHHLEQQEVNQLANDIEQQGIIITDALGTMLNMSDGSSSQRIGGDNEGGTGL